MKKLLHTYSPLADINSIISIHGFTECNINDDGFLRIRHGNQDYNYDKTYSQYLSLVEHLIKSSYTIGELDIFIKKTYENIEHAYQFFNSLFSNGIITFHSDKTVVFDYHKISSFGHFIQPKKDKFSRIDLNNSAIPHYKSDISFSCNDYPSVCRNNLSAKTLYNLISKRCSVRKFIDKPINKCELDYILLISSGIISDSPHKSKISHRTIPSAGSLYPIKIYIVCLNVNGIPKGIYQYDQINNKIIMINSKLPDDIGSFFITKHIEYKNASVLLFISSYTHSSIYKYGNRGYRYALLEAGHIAQNITMAAIASRIKSVMVGGFDDEKVNLWLGLNKKLEYNLYSIIMGK